MPGCAATYAGSAATSFRTAIPELAMYHFCAFALVCIVSMNLKARSGLDDLAGMDQVQPPDMLTLPGAWPFCVGMYARPSLSDHSGHSWPAPASQSCGSQLPSRLMPSLPSGSSSPRTVVEMLGSRASETSGPSFSLKTVSTKARESLKAWLPAIHFLDAVSYKGSVVPSPVPYSSISKPCMVAASPAGLPV